MASTKWCEKTWEAIFEQAQRAHAETRYKKAEIIYDLALIVARHSNIEHCDMAKLFVLRGELFLAKHDYHKAEESFRSAVMLYDRTGSLGTEIDMAIALRDMSVAFNNQGESRLASQLSTLADQYTAHTRGRLEKCFEIPAA